jgi:nickel-dependent lactate racemase
MAGMELRTAAWYGDRQLALGFPAAWKPTVFAPKIGAPLSDAEIRERLESPVGQRPIRELCSGKRRPLVIVDDLHRPTPAARVLPILLRHFEDAGIRPEAVRILMAPGTHGRPPADAIEKKIGAEAASTCATGAHDCYGKLPKVGRTSFGTPVYVAPEVLESDFIVGIGGLYPNHTGGFGGGSKLALGVLGFRSIANLHFRHGAQGWGNANTRSDFRRDLDEIAQMLGLKTTVSVCVDADRNIVALTAGDHHTYFADLVATQKDAYGAPSPPSSARVVISNAYPIDLSLTFARMKGMLPLRHTAPDASRIAIAACAEGQGVHGLYPYMNAPRNHRRRILSVRLPIEVRRPRSVARRLAGRLSRKVAAEPERKPIWLYCPDAAKLHSLRIDPGEFRATSSWDEVVEGVTDEQGYEEVEAVVYPCAPLQWLA